MADAFAAKARLWDGNPMIAAVVQAFYAVARPLLGDLSGRAVLDFGCGTGLLGLRFAAEAKRLDMVDASPAMLNVLREKIAAQGLRNVTIHQGQLAELGLPQASAQLIVSLMALHHVADIPALLQVLRKICAPGGQIIVGDLISEDGSFHAPDAAAHNGFAPEALGAMFAANGFAVQHTIRHHTMRKPDASGTLRDYPQFILAAQKR